MIVGRLKSKRGLTIIEVLISAVVFMIGFSMLVAVVNSTLLKFSTADMNHANAIAQEVMALTCAYRDTLRLDSTVARLDIDYRLTREVVIKDDLAAVSITVSRVKSGRVLIRLYNECTIRAK
jgi:Tfp pilus assembly protein PilV